MFRVGIFVPVYFREEQVIRCLQSLASSNYKFRDLEVFLCIGINGCRKSFMKDFLIDYIKKYDGKVFSFIRLFDEGENIGKPMMVNKMSDSVARQLEYTYMVSIDSDMEVEDKDWLKKFLIVFGNYKGAKPLGALCSNQSGHNVHMVDSYHVMKMKVGDYTIKTSTSNDGVAGGVLMTPANVWFTIGGYQAFNLYGSDDGHYSRDCFRNGYIMGYVEEISFFHPINQDTGYSEWKYKAIWKGRMS